MKDLIKRTSLPELVSVWKKAAQDISAAFKILNDTEKTLAAIFGDEPGIDFKVRPNSYSPCPDYSAPEKCLKKLHLDAWKVLVQRMELRSVLSINRRKELDKQLQTGEGLPEITEANILALLEGTANNIHLYMDEAAKEVFEMLRPRSYEHDFKTNDIFKIGRKVVRAKRVELKYHGGFSVNYYYESEITALDNVFHTFDGKGTIKTYHGPLSDAISASPDGTGETAYFKFKCFKNGNLHLEFKRPDLVDQLNKIGGNQLNK